MDPEYFTSATAGEVYSWEDILDVRSLFGASIKRSSLEVGLTVVLDRPFSLEGLGNVPHSPKIRTLACNFRHRHSNHFIILRACSESDSLGSTSGSSSDADNDRQRDVRGGVERLEDDGKGVKVEDQELQEDG